MSYSSFEIFVGTYTANSQSKGIYHFIVDPNNHQAVLREVIETENPSFILLAQNLIYAVNELGDLQGKVAIFGYDHISNQHLQEQIAPTLGSHPCHLSKSNSNHMLFASNYSTGTMSVYLLGENGQIKSDTEVIPFFGTGPNEKRQNCSHIHSAILNAKEDQLFVQDLGSDSIYRYRLANSKLTDKAHFTMPAGSGPRHLVLSPDEQYIYVLLELSAEIAVFKNDQNLSAVQVISINRPEFAGYNCAAELKVTANGSFLYATNRGEANVITLFAIDVSCGRLTALEHYDVDGIGPRNFNFSPDQQHLLIANQHSNEIVVFKRDINSGVLHATGFKIEVPQPVFIAVR